ncbi:hypothetical protein DFH08DRAFT_970322 [Mycena albidolilacea]|uniref:Uncharacterized protein n=1 Tax=Mycena albidolilacea TaxID=1033008 RepID=A0AAD6ZFL1_9AGAR|nr:hypothetical protein DFH08DRAFT_970322 [Mycena albidolilacea]
MSDIANPPEKYQCSRLCYQRKTLVEYKTTLNGGRAKTCLMCQRQAREGARKRKADSDNDKSNDDELGVLGLVEFINVLTQQDDNLELDARVEISSLAGTGREKADQLALLIWKKMKYRFVYHSKYDRSKSDRTRFMYHCAQNQKRQHKLEKSEHEGAKHRDKIAMDSFDCHGWLHITLHNSDNIVLVKISHRDDHIPYWCIDVPAHVTEFLWDEVLKTYPRLSFTRRAIFSMWPENSAKEWKLDADELVSANILLNKFRSLNPLTGENEGLYSVEPIPLAPEHGFTAIAFALPRLLREVGGRIRELSLDSAWNTNGSRYEIYALLGEFMGLGCPLVIFLSSRIPGALPVGKND